MSRWTWLLVTSVGCSGGHLGTELGSDASGDDTGQNVDPNNTDDPGTDPPPFTGAPLTAISGSCPDVSGSGMRDMTSGGHSRHVLVKIPASGGQGKPLAFFFHGLGGSAQLYDTWLDFQAFADSEDMVVVAPDSVDTNGNTWILEEGPDMVLFDDVRSCLAQDLGIDLARVYTTGFSFGGLFTTALSMDRGDSLAASLAMSGGTNSLWFPYRSPADTLPVLVMWGGPGDTFGSGVAEVRFEDMSLDFSSNLIGDGHLVHHCDHGLGHDVPPEWSSIVGNWFGSHTYDDVQPVVDGDYPSWCFAP